MKPVPRITVSYAQSLDGRIATSTGKSQWISCPQTLSLAHTLRRDNEVIIAGIGTVLQDDPELSCRLESSVRSPVRAILDSHLRIPLDSTILRTCGSYPTIVYTTDITDNDKRGSLEQAGVRVIEFDRDENQQVPVKNVVESLAAQGFRSVFVEGGAKVITSFLFNGLVHRMVVVVAPVLIGSGIEAVGDLEIRDLSQALRPKQSSFRRIGIDCVWELIFDGS